MMNVFLKSFSSQMFHRVLNAPLEQLSSETYPANNYMFKSTIETPEKGVNYVQS